MTASFFLAPSLSLPAGSSLPCSDEAEFDRLDRRATDLVDSGECPAMLEDQFIDLIDPLLRDGGSVLEDGRGVPRAAAGRAPLLPPAGRA